jgi:hypothetical protein
MAIKKDRSILNIPNYFLIPIIVCIALGLAYSSIHIFTGYQTFKESGTMGDTIGGLTAPVFSLIASILVFISFKEQYKANQLQKQALDQEIKRTNSINEYNQIVDLINEIKIEVDSLSFHYDPLLGMQEGKDYYGIDTIANLNKTVFEITTRKYIESFWDELVLSLNLINFTINKIDSYQYKKEEQQVLKIKFYNFLKKISSDIYTYSTLLQKARIPVEFKHFHLFIAFEKAITEFVENTQKEVLNNPDIITTKMKFK